MEKRFQVFVSSTYTDLAEERAEVVSMLLNLDALPAGMELFPATNDDAWTLIKRVIDESDYYLLVVGGRYGSVDDATSLSYTEKEFDYAVETEKPVMAFLHADPGKIAAEKTDQSDTARAKLAAFRTKVEKAVHVNYWATSNDLSGLVAKSFVKIQKSHPAIGWVRGDVQTTTESIEELNSLRKRLEDAESRLDAARKGPPPGAEKFSQGSDEISLPVTVSFDIRDEYHTMQGYNAHVETKTTWDAVFSAIGGSLIDEARQDVMQAKLNDWLAHLVYPDAAAKKDAWVASERIYVARDRYVETAIGHADFETIIVQLRALGLITMSDRKRSLKDTGTYWTLTPYGDERLVALRAFRRGTSSPATIDALPAPVD